MCFYAASSSNDEAACISPPARQLFRQPCLPKESVLHLGRTQAAMANPFPEREMHDLRILPLEGASNFRDVGGIPAADSRILKTGLLFRSDELSQLTRADREKLGGLKLKTVVDLRTADERRSQRSRLPGENGLRTLSIPIRPGQDFTRGQLFVYILRHPGQVDFEKLIRDYYFTMAFERTAQVGEILTLLADEGNLPALIHCTAGKDRTGFLAALVQWSLGVAPETVLEDYLLTNRLLKPERKDFIRSLRWVNLLRASPAGLQPVLEARREYLQAVLDEIVHRYGNVEAYLEHGCGVDAGALRALRALLLA
jgi:protein-tyrosine phosphatase